MKCFVLFYGVLIIFLVFYIQDSLQISTRQLRARRCPSVKIANGQVRQRGRGRILRFQCNPGFNLVGSRYTTCLKGQWEDPPPVCASTECAPIDDPENGRAERKYNGAVIMVFCEPGYERQGPLEIYCNGRAWNDSVPTCKNTRLNPPTSCNFENPDLCLWEQDPLHDFDWVRHNFNTPSWRSKTGPSHDHTLGPGYNGYYLYIEANDKLENTSASIISPLYSSELTEAGCFSFWYHMYGATIGTLNIHFKAEGEPDRRLMFTKSGDQGDQWLHGLFQLPKENTSFQIIIEGVRGNGYFSDIAIDDVAIFQGDECLPIPYTVADISPTYSYENWMQTCSGRCSDSNATDDSTKLCQCSADCIENRNCCPDYLAYCILNNDTTDFSPEYTETTVTPKFISTAMVVPKISTPYNIPGTDRVPIPINPTPEVNPREPKIPQNPNSTSRQPRVTVPPKVVPKISSTTKAGSSKPPRVVPKILTTPRTTTTTTTTSQPPYVTTRRPTVTSTVPTGAKSATNADGNFNNQIGTRDAAEKNQSSNRVERGKVTLPGIIGIVVGAIVGIAGTVLIVFLVFQKRNSYKNGSRTSALSDDSDVRFLTSDEMLDFNLAKPEDMDM